MLLFSCGSQINLMLLDFHCPVKCRIVHVTIGTPLLDFISISVWDFFRYSSPSFLSGFLLYFVHFKFKNLTGSFLDRECLTQPFLSNFNASFGFLVNVRFFDVISRHCLFTSKCDLVTYSFNYYVI